MKPFVVYIFVNVMQFVVLLKDTNWLSGYKTDSEEIKQVCFSSFFGAIGFGVFDIYLNSMKLNVFKSLNNCYTLNNPYIVAKLF